MTATMIPFPWKDQGFSQCCTSSKYAVAWGTADIVGLNLQMYQPLKGPIALHICSHGMPVLWFRIKIIVVVRSHNYSARMSILPAGIPVDDWALNATCTHVCSAGFSMLVIRVALRTYPKRPLVGSIKRVDRHETSIINVATSTAGICAFGTPNRASLADAG